MSSEIASVWYCLHSFLLIWILWVVLYRSYRTDVLKEKLHTIEWELADAPSSLQTAGLQELVASAMREASQLTTTRLLLAWIAARYAHQEQEETTDAAMVDIRRRIIRAIASHGRLLPLWAAGEQQAYAAVRIALASARSAS